MKYTDDNIFEYINNLSKNINASILQSSENIDAKSCRNIVCEYLDIGIYLTSAETTPESVKIFLTSDEDLREISLPAEYEPLKKILDFYDFTSKYFENKIKEYVSKNNFEKITEYMVFAVKTNIKNVKLFDYIADRYENEGLYNELIELYKLMFVYTTDTGYFEKIGDIYYKQEDYNSALDSYLSYAESSDETVEIYQKLANVFGKINDNDSRLACLEHIKTIEGENGKY